MIGMCILISFLMGVWIGSLWAEHIVEKRHKPEL